MPKTPARSANVAPGRERGSTEIGLETPKIVEMLAHPQQDEGRVELCLVAASGSFSHTREQAPAAFRIADVWRRSRRGVGEGIGERHEPGAQRLNLVI